MLAYLFQSIACEPWLMNEHDMTARNTMLVFCLLSLEQSLGPIRLLACSATGH